MPAIDHQLITRGTTHAQQTAEMMIGIESILISEKPDWLLIYGDTNSTLAGALAAAKLHIPIAHVEAGLRSYNRKMPEEINRLVADQLASVLFTPTNVAMNNLLIEGYPTDRMMMTGDVMYDAALFYGNKASATQSTSPLLSNLTDDYVLATIHRAENTNDPNKLLSIFSALEKVTDEIKVILPLHPRTRKFLSEFNPLILKNTNIIIVDPIGFLDMVRLEKNAKLIVTDSGGIQKEAFFYQVPCVTLRDETEWTETITLGWNRLAPTNDSDTVFHHIMSALGSHGESNHYPYGTGDAADRIANFFAENTSNHAITKTNIAAHA